jgi:hypothetical protein
MATIKRNGDKIILKNGKVSCTCCEEPECCMYPADQLGVTYTEDDLPDAVWVKNTFYGSSGDSCGVAGVVLQKNISGDKYYQGTSSCDDITRDWFIRNYNGNWLTYAFFANTSSPCLIAGDGNFTPEDDRVEDQFADSYEAIIRFDGAPDYTRTVTRISLCVWIYEDEFDFVQLRYSSTALGDFEKWDLSLTGDSGGFFAKKTDPQNTPVGEYDTGIGATATVSEA